MAMVCKEVRNSEKIPKKNEEKLKNYRQTFKRSLWSVQMSS